MSAEPSFGQVVKSRRRDLGLTQDELARRVGCAPVTLRKIEYDDLRSSIQIAERLAMALNVALEERAAFVRLARLVRVSEPAISTPVPRREEIGLEDLSGRAVRGYALAERIGQGGMGAVYRAVQPVVGREVAIKIILPQYADHPDFIRRFEAEAQLIARLEHPHIVPLYDYWREPGVAYLVMRLLRGGSVRTLLENGALPLDRVNRLIEQISQALAAAHRAGVVHRDLKPGNILLDEDGNAYLADFGIAKNLPSPVLEGVTQAGPPMVGSIAGSPPYLSPEQIRSDVVRPTTDIYCLGVVLYEMLTGVLPFTGPTPIDVLHQHLSAPLPPLAARRAGLPGALDAVIGRATAKDPAQRYPTVDDLLADWRRAIAAPGLAADLMAAAIPPAPVRVLTDLDNPYKGLRAFTEADADDFFGREALIQQLLIRLGEGGDLARILALVGPSGSGKSSVIEAGLIPALRRGGLPGSERWFIVELTPGPHPYEALEAALLRVAVNSPAGLLAQLQDGPRGLLRAVERCLPPGDDAQLVLVVDQFEEVFTLLTDEAKRARLLASLVAAVLDEGSRVRVMLTLRADFTDRPLRYVDFGELLRQRSEFVLPLTPDELESAILGPAQRAGLTLEAGLSAALIRDVGDQPGALPLLQYALTELFERRAGATLTRHAYSELGGLTGALAHRAEAAFVGLDLESQAAARQLFLRLVTLGEGVEDTRRRVPRTELDAVGAALALTSPALIPREAPPTPVLDAFGKARLLSFDRDPATRAPTVEVAHEALLREWPRLRGWLDQSRGDIRLQRTLAQAAAEWQAANRDPSYLLTGARLAQFEGWMTAATVALTPAERAFFDASVAERQRREKEEAERQQRELDAAKKLAETERARAESEERRAEEQTRSAARLRQRALYLALALGAAMMLLIATLGLAQLSNQARAKAEQQAALASARELDAAAELQVSADPQLSLLLALQAISVTRAGGLGDPLDVQQTLHDIVPAQRLVWTLDVPYWAAKVAYSAGGTRITVINVSDAADKTYILDARTRQELATVKGYGFAYSPDEKLIATGDWHVTPTPSKVYISDAITGQLLVTMTGSLGACSFAFSPDGNTLATGCWQEGMSLWDLRAWRAAGEPAGFTISEPTRTLGCFQVNYHSGLNFSPDGKRLVAVCAKDRSAKVLDVATGKELLSLTGHIAPVNNAIFSPDGQRLATTSADGARIWDATTGQELLRLTALDAMSDLAFSPDGQLLATGSGELAIVWDANTGARLFDLPNPRILDGLAFSPDGSRLLTAMLGTIREWDVTVRGPGELATTSTPRAAIYDFNNSRDGSRFATILNDGILRLFDSATLQPVWAAQLFTPTVWGADGISFNADRTLLSASVENTVTVWNIESRQPLLTLIQPSNVFEAAFSPDGRQLAVALDGGGIVLWDIAAQKALQTLHPLTGTLNCPFSIEFSPDGERLAAGGSDGTPSICADGGRGWVYVWDLGDETRPISPSRVLSFDGRQINHISFSPDGRRLAAAGTFDGAVVWDAITGQPVFTLTAHTGSVADINYSPNGKYLATASTDKTVKVWDAQTGAELISYPLPDLGRNAFFTPDNRELVIETATGISTRPNASLNAFLNFDDLVAVARARLLRDWQPAECLKYLHVPACPEK